MTQITDFCEASAQQLKRQCNWLAFHYFKFDRETYKYSNIIQLLEEKWPTDKKRAVTGATMYFSSSCFQMSHGEVLGHWAFFLQINNDHLHHCLGCFDRIWQSTSSPCPIVAGPLTKNLQLALYISFWVSYICVYPSYWSSC